LYRTADPLFSVAKDRLGTTIPAAKLRFETTGLATPAGYADSHPDAWASVTVRLSNAPCDTADKPAVEPRSAVRPVFSGTGARGALIETRVDHSRGRDGLDRPMRLRSRGDCETQEDHGEGERLARGPATGT